LVENTRREGGRHQSEKAITAKSAKKSTNNTGNGDWRLSVGKGELTNGTHGSEGKHIRDLQEKKREGKLRTDTNVPGKKFSTSLTCDRSKPREAEK